ncbi:MAG TPA: hypothetical protein VMX17_05705 [Candidatus Glassbacteria bacterium]|jgi:hypothetical protein|nr:hypothetical protein [Candidatus Glassbacteria bacterium]
MLNRLKNQRVYLVGAMDRVLDRGMGWRESITPFLEHLGVTVYNPLKKPSDIGKEDHDSFLKKLEYKSSKDYDKLSDMMKMIRNVDLRLVDISDFIIANLDLDTHPCGTYEEIFLANRQKKPIIVHVQQGKQNCPDWLFGCIPHQLFFSDWNEIKVYLNYVNSCDTIENFNRWYFFN